MDDLPKHTLQCCLGSNDMPNLLNNKSEDNEGLDQIRDNSRARESGGSTWERVLKDQEQHHSCPPMQYC